MKKKRKKRGNKIVVLVIGFFAIALLSAVVTMSLLRFFNTMSKDTSEVADTPIVDPAENNPATKIVWEDNEEEEIINDEPIEITWEVQGIDEEEDVPEDTAKERADVIEAIVKNSNSFDSIIFDIDYDDLKEAGFELGDSCNIEFESGERIEDIPYYSAYYTPINGIILCSYDMNSDLELCCYLNQEYWKKYKIEDGDTVKIECAEIGKYKDVEHSMKMTYPNNRAEYPNDESYANFRELKGGDIMPGVFFRGSSPINPEINRIDYVNALMKKNNIKFVLDLSDSESEYIKLKDKNISDFSYDINLFLEDKISFFGLNFQFTDEDYSKWIVSGLNDILKHDGPYYIHCTEGKDRTGFVCILLEALAGASYNEMKYDYMLSYYYYFGISKETNEKVYDMINEQRFKTFMYILSGQDSMENLRDVDYQAAAREYLYSGGMSEKEVNRLYAILTGIVIED